MSLSSARSAEPAAVTAALRALLAAFSRAWQERRYSDLATWLAPDMVFLLPGGNGSIGGRDAVIDSYREFMERISLTSYREAPPNIDVWGQPRSPRHAGR